MDVVARVDRRFDSSTILAVLKAIVSLYLAGRVKPIERCKSSVKDAEENKSEENKLFSSFQKNIIEFLGLNEKDQKFGLGSFHLKFYRLTKICENQWQSENLRHINTKATGTGITLIAWLRWGKRAKR